LNIWLKRIGLILLIAGLTVTATILVKSAREEHISKKNITLQKGWLGIIYYYFHDNTVEFLIEIMPSGSAVDIYLQRMGSPERLVEFNNVDSAEFKLEPSRGLYMLVLQNKSKHDTSILITFISKGIQRSIMYTGMAAIALGAVCLAANKLLGLRETRDIE